MATTRPARSEPHLTPEEAARVEAEVRGYFQSVAPKRPAKPPRSDPSEDAGAEAEADAGDHDLPELRKLRDLEAKPQAGVHNAVAVSASEYRSCKVRSAADAAATASGTARFDLKKGVNYFICGVPGHCAAGMKIRVVAN